MDRLIETKISNENRDQLLIFRRQCLQLSDLQHISWPSSNSLRKYAVQEWIYEQLFADNEHHFLPPERYRLRLLKPLLAKIETSIVDPEEDVRAIHFLPSPHFFLFLVISQSISCTPSLI